MIGVVIGVKATPITTMYLKISGLSSAVIGVWHFSVKTFS